MEFYDSQGGTGMALAIEDVETIKEPQPGESSKKRRGRRSKASIEAEIRDQLTALLQMIAMVWATRDDVCSIVLNTQAPLIAEDLAAFAARSEWARKYLTQTMEVGQILPLLMHITPLFQAIREHHITSRFEETEEGTDAGTGPVG
jgi:hypothetical protein